MTGRRITYIVLLIAAAVFHYAYGQYVTHYMLLFLVFAPLLSVLFSLPSAAKTRIELLGGQEVCRSRESRVRLRVKSSALLPPEAWSITVNAKNLFTGKTVSRQKIKAGGTRFLEKDLMPDTSQIGSILYTVEKAFVYDYLGLIPIPVKKGGRAAITVLPDMEIPDPEPDLIEDSARTLKPKPMGFSEEHELRPFRDGDPLNLIHWKLSSKYDELIIREPQEVIRKDIIIVIDLPEEYDEHRSVLEQLAYLNEKLQKEQIRYMVQYGNDSVFIGSQNEYDDFIRGVLSEPMRSGIAPTPEHGTDALICRIHPGKGARR